MKQKKGTWVITGINPLTRQREPLTRELTYERAAAILERDRHNPRRRQTWSRLRAERVGPGQLKITIE